jgi:hypothetical protein
MVSPVSAFLFDTCFLIFQVNKNFSEISAGGYTFAYFLPFGTRIAKHIINYFAPFLNISMATRLEDVTINFQDLDLEDICSAWQWRIQDQKGLILISKMGDMFFLGKDGCVYWLQTDSGDLTKIADNFDIFEGLITQYENFNNWFLPGLIEQLEQAGKTLGPNQVYSYLKIPVIGGEYSIDNIEPTDISVHFAFSGQICEQIQNLPDGTKVNISFKKNSN